MNSIEAKLQEIYTQIAIIERSEPVPDADHHYLIRELRASLTREKVLRGAVEFYASEPNWYYDKINPSDYGGKHGSGGNRARAALSATKADQSCGMQDNAAVDGGGKP